ncbi:MAG: CapA family protein [Bacteroidota bacterium]
MTQVVNYILIIIILQFNIANTFAQVSFCAVGDVLLDRGVRKNIEKNNVFYPFENIRNIISQNDIALFNLECPLVDSSNGYPLNKKYSFRAEPSYIEGVKYAGFNIASVANNHTIDYGKDGFLKTIELLEKNNIFPVGGGKNQIDAFKPVLIEKDGETFAFFALLEFLLEATTFNENRPYPAFGQIDRLCKVIQKYNSRIDNIIVSFHWGKENVIVPSARQIEYAHKVIDAGADLVLGHHPHVIQSIETYRNKLIVYSLGNFIFDNSRELQKQSIIFQCKFREGSVIEPHLIPVNIKNNRPEIANKSTSYEIFEHLKKVSGAFNTTYTFDREIIQINYKANKPIKEIFYEDFKFNIFKNQISVCDNKGFTYSYTLPDTNYNINDVCAHFEDDVVYFYTIVVNKATDKSRVAIFPFSINDCKFLRPSLDNHEDFNPWKIEIFDVDKDENLEIILGVNKSTRYYEDKENRIFVFNREKDYIFPKWLGSKVGNPIIDFKIDKISESLIILEVSKDTTVNKVVSYKWNGFGFDNDKILYDLENDKNKRIHFLLADIKFNTL